MYLILVKPFACKIPLSCRQNHDVPSISFPLVSSKLYWIISLQHITVVAVFEVEELRPGGE